MQTPKEKARTHLHFVGIGGIGMSGIAEVFLNQGYPVSGSDISESELTKRLASMGATIHIGHRGENLNQASVVVISSAVRPSNPEVQEARRRRIPVIPRAEMLGELMRGKTGISVAGTHGKTTTTSMLATIFTEAGLDPTLVIGGRVDSLGGNAKWGSGQYVVAEADESDGSFLRLPGTFGVITNIDNDHLDHYGSFEGVEDAFVDFVANMPFYGMVAVCAEDPGVRRCLPRFSKPVATYGYGPDWDFRATDIEKTRWGTRFTVHRRVQGLGGAFVHEKLGVVELQVPGKHNVLNALGALAVAVRAGISFPIAAVALTQFKGVRRRFEVKWRSENSQRIIVDDYGHHPTEIRATLATARDLWEGRIIVVFQPHRYSRTQHCMDEFGSVFSEADLLLMTDIYSAGEAPIEGISTASILTRVGRSGRAPKLFRHVADLEVAASEVAEIFQDGDLVLCLGAGSITRLPEKIIEKVKEAPVVAV